ncbi:9566_t:CDS:2 [Acaulospora colombiana]|uniref:9566_t:CDS:1 n=1 Tax=Acaulospora colombiana TaxID=27376 RepID=A0ACA9LBD2_9GLOM|nr:9566_t:CDS:2 [Acaulospora colombiana]
MPSALPDYYTLLGLDDKRCTTEAIRAAYKRESLRREKGMFSVTDVATAPTDIMLPGCYGQAVADAYYVLSDPARRREYDALLASRAYTERSADADASNNFFANFANMFAGAAAGTNAPQTENKPEDLFGERPDPDATFGNVFDERESYHGGPFSVLHRMHTLRLDSWVSDFFLVAQRWVSSLLIYRERSWGALPETVLVFNTLAADQKAEILKSLAFKVLGSISNASNSWEPKLSGIKHLSASECSLRAVRLQGSYNSFRSHTRMFSTCSIYTGESAHS